MRLASERSKRRGALIPTWRQQEESRCGTTRRWQSFSNRRQLIFDGFRIKPKLRSCATRRQFQRRRARSRDDEE